MCSKTHRAGRSEAHRDARLEPSLADRDQLAGLHLAQQRRADDVERTALGGDHVALAELPEAQRPHAGRVAERDHALVCHDDRRVGALQTLHDVRDRVLDALRGMRGDQGGDDLRVRRGAEPHALRGQLVVQLDRVDQVAVVAQSDRPAVVAVHGLRVLPSAAAGGRVAHVADRHLARERLEAALVEDLGDEAEVALGGDVTALGGGDAGRLLAAVLERVEREVGETRDVLLRGIDAEHAALVPRALARSRVRWGGRALARRCQRQALATVSRHPVRQG